ncbi:Dot/Icm secretion system protein DotA [Candidatus Rickettsiella viridis]|uniref:Dot/Icm secretion system protein DotA n=1 Tax=Candidatus Rickettsiella viridis TaxID=676208 RepID=A0A2Z5UX53_9COXI|nr:type IVB secretion system protein DotA [Candidatus Rickettsiella viridis]BBB15603.1 Dot/Icm secretion system protein DotA [Candidatus Rickettsiella viridis]
MKKILVSLFIGLFPSLLLADSLAPPASDLSVSYLATIFGVVDGVLHGTGSQILGTMLGSFNAAILVMASVLLTYALFISILNTAHQGEFLGQKWSSIWVPLRMVSGVGLLLPKATGYSFIQILVMWVVVQGVGAADQVWNVALDYMNRNGTVIEPVQGLASGGSGAGKSADNTFLVTKSGDILKSEVCMYTLYNGLVRQYKGKGIEVPDFASSLSVTGKGPNGSNTGKLIDYTKDKGGFITFPGKMDGTFAKYQGACGSVSWDFIGKADNAQVANPANLTANDSASIGVRQMTLDMNSMAKGIANKLAPAYDDQVSKVTLKKDDPLLVSNSLVYTSADYFAIVKPALRALKAGADTNLKDFIKDAKDTGWILAGSYYYQMAKLNESLRKINDLSVIKDQITPTFSPDYDSSVFKDINNPIILDNLKNNLPTKNGVIDDYIQNETTKAGNTSGGNQLFPSTGGDVSGTNGLLRQFLGSTFQSVDEFQKKLQKGLDNSGADPILTLSSIGDDLVHLVESVWISFFVIVTAVVVLGGVTGAAVSFFAPAGPIIAVLGALFGFIGLFMPIFTFWLMINLSLGATLAYYVPLIPFILFTFGAVTWFVIVLESVMAAPLVALGITHPEGHDFLGKAEQAVMLLASVFLRPMLMVFGFIFGIILSYVSISLLNQGFSIALRFMGGLGQDWLHGDILGLVSQTTLMIIYTSVILALVNRSFGMIYEVPNKVMRWIGAQAENTPEEGMLNQIRGSVDSNMREIGQAGSQAVQSGMQQGVSDMRSIGKQMQANKANKDKGTTVSPTGSAGNE